jgi:arginyl-tRNA synthetase
MKQIIINLLKETLKEKIKLKKQEIENLIEIPPFSEMGDYAFPCFFLSKKFKQNPDKIAESFAQKIKLTKEIEKVENKGAYINFFVNKELLAKNTIAKILKQGDNYGKIILKKPIKTMVEFSSPNTNKPLHLGHLRNMAIGESISRILEFNGEKVIRTSLNNDKGIHICKSIAAYKLYGKGKNPKSEKKKSDHFVGDFYVMFNNLSKQNKTLEIESQELLQKLEKGDKETINIWKKMNKWALDGFKETYKKFGIKFDNEFFESNIYKKGKEIVLEGLKKGIFTKRKDGAIIINLEKEGLGEKVLLRSDGTSVYVTQDLYLAKLKQERFKINKSIYVVANEQNYHFNVLFTLLKKLKFKLANNLKHLAYGMVCLPEGKMKSREGTVVDADDLIGKVQKLIKKELEKRQKLSEKELEERSLIISLASIKYMLLKIDIKKDILFNPKESMNFEGDTGPYLQYSYARASSILRKLKIRKEKFKINKLENEEFNLVKKLSEFSEIVSKSYNSLNPSIIANYSYQLAQIFNEFYHKCPVINAGKNFFRLSLVNAFRQTLKNSLYLLGIEIIEKM